MKKISPLFFLLSVFIANGQIGIGTSSPSAELEIQANSSGLPALKLSPQTAPIGTAAGQLSVIDNALYLYDDIRSKWLSVETTTVTFGREGSLNNQNLEYAGDITNNSSNMPHNGTITYVALNCSGGNLSKIIHLRVYDNTRTLTQTHSFQLVNGVYLATDLNIDFSAGDYFLVYVDNDLLGDVNDLSFVIWAKWRK